MDEWYKTSRISSEYNWTTTSDRPFKSGDTEIMVVDEVSYRAITIGQELWNLSWWSWMLTRERKMSEPELLLHTYLQQGISQEEHTVSN